MKSNTQPTLHLRKLTESATGSAQGTLDPRKLGLARAGAHRNPARIYRVRAGAESRGVTQPVPLVYLPVSLTAPGPSGGTEPARLCRGCSRPPRRLPAQASSSFTPPLRRRRDRGLPPPSANTSASWRTISFCKLLAAGQSPSCTALKILPRSRRTCSSWRRQSTRSQASPSNKGRPSGPFTEVSNLPVSTGIYSRFASAAHLPTSAPLRGRVARPGIRASYTRAIREEIPALQPRFPGAFRPPGICFLGTLSCPGVQPPYGRLTAPPAHT